MEGDKCISNKALPLCWHLPNHHLSRPLRPPGWPPICQKGGGSLWWVLTSHRSKFTSMRMARCKSNEIAQPDCQHKQKGLAAPPSLASKANMHHTPHQPCTARAIWECLPNLSLLTGVHPVAMAEHKPAISASKGMWRGREGSAEPVRWQISSRTDYV